MFVLSINVLFLSEIGIKPNSISSNFAIAHRYLLCDVTFCTITATLTEKTRSSAIET